MKRTKKVFPRGKTFCKKNMFFHENLAPKPRSKREMPLPGFEPTRVLPYGCTSANQPAQNSNLP